jgi:hypothetical protein
MCFWKRAKAADKVTHALKADEKTTGKCQKSMGLLIAQLESQRPQFDQLTAYNNKPLHTLRMYRRYRSVRYDIDLLPVPWNALFLYNCPSLVGSVTISQTAGSDNCVG